MSWQGCLISWPGMAKQYCILMTQCGKMTDILWPGTARWNRLVSWPGMMKVGKKCGMGSGNSSVVERWTPVQRNTGLSPSRINFFSRVSFLCWLLLWYPFRPCVTTVAHKRSQSLCQKCTWQVTAKHIHTLNMWLCMKWHCKLVEGCMVYTERALRWQQFCLPPAM